MYFQLHYKIKSFMYTMFVKIIYTFIMSTIKRTFVYVTSKIVERILRVHKKLYKVY